MSTPTSLTPDSSEALVQLFWQLNGRLSWSRGTVASQDQEAARRIVQAVGPAAEATTCAAAYAREFSRDLLPLAETLQHPSENILLMTSQPPTGCALIAASVGRHVNAHSDSGRRQRY